MYNLFVSGGDGAWQGVSYSFPADRFGEYTDEDIRSRYQLPLSDEKRRELESFPCLFAYEGVHDVHVGQLTAITTNGSRLKVRFTLGQVSIPAETFASIRNRLDIGNQWELNRTHWAIKEVDLAKVLESSGVQLPDFMTPAAPTSDGASTQDVSELPEVNVEFLRRRGSGAFGTVWEAREKLLERRIAIKFLTSTDEAYDESALLREARNLARISHPSLVTVLGAARLRHPETRLPAPAILMEYLDGPDLDDWWNVLRDPEQVLRVARQFVEGVLAMHDMHDGKVVHGDLHPKNVVVLDGGWPKIIDWRYQDSGWLKPTTYARNELGAEVRRVYDIVGTLLSNQSVELSIVRTIAGKA